MTDQSNPMTVPLRRTPARFRWWLGACLVALVAAFVLLHARAPGPDLATIVAQPGALMLLALIVLADLYPTLPWMRGSNPFDEFIFSTPLAIAALMVFGPHAAIVFVIAGFAMTLALRLRWWRIVLNTALWGVQGAAAAGVLALIWHSAGWADEMPPQAMIPMTILLAVVIEGLNIVLVMAAQFLAGATTPRAYLADWPSQVAIGTLDLTAPIPAALAAAQPALLPLLAIAMVAAQAGLGAVTSRTAQAGTDPLTSLPNRAHLLARIRSRLAAPQVDRRPVTVLLVDLDRFKQVNDDLGHLVGDRVLVEVARRLEESTRSSDVVARFGGDEFAVLLTGGPGQRNAEEVATRIREAVSRPIHLGGRSIQVGVSIGWALADRHDTDPLMLLHRADTRLYAEKAARRPASSPPALASAQWPAEATDAPSEELFAGPIWSAAPARLIRAHDGSAPVASAP